jgi:dTDP-4-amino-4,6-dideoxygalactose transaminase
LQTKLAATQARENAPWYQHEEVGYNYRMSNVIAGVVRGQYPYLEEHIAQKKEIYERYRDGFKDLPVQMNPIMDSTEPNYWLSAMIIDKDYMCKQVRDDSKALYISEKGKTCPTEILETLAKYNAEGRPIWKPMHMQPVYKGYDFIGEGVSEKIFENGVCLPSDTKMTDEDLHKVCCVIKGLWY